MATKRIKAFIDSNVLANWMLLDAAVREVAPKGEKALKDLRELSSRRYPSYELLQELLASSKRLPFTFGTSTVAISETTHVIFEEYIHKKLYEKGIPFQYWGYARNRQKLSSDDETDLFRQLQRFLALFFPTRLGPIRWYEKYDFIEVSLLIGMYRLSTTDAVLMGEALRTGCKYFVTEDTPLRELLRSRGDIKLMPAHTMLQTLKAHVIIEQKQKVE